MKSSQAVSSKHRVRFLVMSDTHDLTLSNLPEADVLIHCGDITEQCSTEKLRDALKFLLSIKAELRLVIAGNHDVLLDSCSTNFYYEQPELHNEAVGLMSETPGITYLQEGTRRFTLDCGASFTFHALPYTPSQYGIRDLSHAFQYASNEDRYNTPSDANGALVTPNYTTDISTCSSKVPDFPGVDILITHGPPKYILDHARDGSSAGCEYLRRALCRAKPRLHCFGHIHEGHGA